MTTLPTTQLAVMGDPIAHSKSPAIHRAAYRELGVDWRYGAIRCGEASLEAWLTGRGPEWRGFSLTMPLKEEAFRLASQLDPVAEASGVVNTLLRLDEGETPSWAGFNTDVAGLARAIAGAGLNSERTIVLGAGATAVSAILAARRLGAAEVTVLARRPAAAAVLAERFDGSAEPGRAPIRVGSGALARGGEMPSESPTLVISTLPGHGVDWSNMAVQAGSAPLFDVAYNPWPSAGAQSWRAAGGAIHSGIGMLVEQALIQVRIFTTGDPESTLPGEERVLAAMRAAAE